MISKIVLNVQVFIVILIAGVLCEDEVTVNIKQGELLGKVARSAFTERNYYSFKGIPYAEPPVGELRFQPPVEHSGWEGTLKAFRHGNYCVQIDVFHEEQAHGNEDCLFLNVYTPHLKGDLNGKEPLPVMLFIHGNYFRFGSGNTTFFGPDHFMEEDVILVTINFRLGIFGFLDLEDEVVNGNMGMKDMVMGLKWIQKNIEQFGGDPNKVTIFGSGAGGVAVDLLVLSPTTKGLFSRAICQSGVSLMSTYLSWGPKGRAITLAKLLGETSDESKDLLKKFKSVDAFEYPLLLTKTVDVDDTIKKQFGVLPFAPSINVESDGAFITEYPEEIFAAGKLPNPDVSLMFGFNSQESIYFQQYFVSRPHLIRTFNKRFQYLFPLRDIYAEFNSYYYHEIAYRLKHFYFTDGFLNVSRDDAIDEFLTFQSDLTVYPVDRTVRAYLNCSNAPIYYYRFSHEGKLNYFKTRGTKSIYGENAYTKVEGASEMDEICYLFKCGKIRSSYKKLEEDDTDLMMIKKMVRLWTNFARTGNPTPKDDDILEGLIWEPAKKDKINYLDINKNPTMGVNPHSQSVEFWDAMYEHYTPLATNGILTAVKDEL